MNYIIQPAIDGEWGEVHDYVLQDAVTQAQWELEQFGAETALRNIPALKTIIEHIPWRAADAANIMSKIVRVALADNVITVTEVEHTPW